MLLYGTVNEQDALYNLQDSPRSVVCPRKLVVAFAPWLVTAQGLSQRPLRLDPSEERRAWVSRQKLQKYFIDELSIDVKDDNKCHGLFKRALEVGCLGRRARPSARVTTSHWAVLTRPAGDSDRVRLVAPTITSSRLVQRYFYEQIGR